MSALRLVCKHALSLANDYQENEDRQALEAFVVENDDLDQLEAIVDQFNVFESIGVARQELRHSDFLAFLTDPRQNHGLGQAFVRRFLQKVLVSAKHPGPPISPIHLDSWDLSQLTVRREWQNIDLLLVDPTNRFVVLIENKIGSGEHSDQLRRYLHLVRAGYPETTWQLLADFLTPEGDSPSEAEYVPAAYGTVAEAVEAVAKSRRDAIEPAVYYLMIHYASMLRRHVVTDSPIADLCRRIYSRHQRALDLIFEHRPDRLAEIHALLVSLVKSTSGLILDHSPKQQIRFSSDAWKGLPHGEGWTHSGRILLFQFDNTATGLDLSLWIGPGPQDVRQQFFQAAHESPSLFKFGKKNPEAHKWSSIFRRSFLKTEDYETLSFEDIEQRITERWNHFVDHDSTLLIDAMRPDVVGFDQQVPVGK